MTELSGIKMLQAMKKMNNTPVNDNLVFGTVKKLNPLEIEIKQGVILTEEFLFLGQMCRPHKVTIPHTHKYSGKTEKSSTDIKAVTTATIGPSPTVGVITITDPTHEHQIKNQETDDVHKEKCGTDYEKSVTIEIEPKLKEGDRVLMFAFNNFQMYYVAERLEEEK